MKNSFCLCINNKECPDLEIRKVYHRMYDPVANNHGQIRIVDESGEDYLYPEEYFVAVELPETAEKAFRSVA